MGHVCHKGTLIPGKLRRVSHAYKRDVIAPLPQPAKVAPRPNVHSAPTFVPGLGLVAVVGAAEAADAGDAAVHGAV